jgi:site-specific DNA-cytosine methylase
MEEQGINVVSLFNGMGCIWIALEELGIKVNKRYSSEIDKYANKVNDFNYPDTIQLGDITKLSVNDFGDQPIHLVAGGSPC